MYESPCVCVTLNIRTEYRENPESPGFDFVLRSIAKIDHKNNSFSVHMYFLGRRWILTCYICNYYLIVFILIEIEKKIYSMVNRTVQKYQNPYYKKIS